MARSKYASVYVSMPRMSYQPERQGVLQSFTQHALRYLLGNKAAKLRVSVKVVATVLRKDTRGQCASAKMVHLSNALDPKLMLEVLAHELCHVAQYADGRMAQWQASTPVNTAYRDQPWEIDAFGREVEVVHAAAASLVAAQPELLTMWPAATGYLQQALRDYARPIYIRAGNAGLSRD